jgi:hypothetical protein
MPLSCFMPQPCETKAPSNELCGPLVLASGGRISCWQLCRAVLYNEVPVHSFTANGLCRLSIFAFASSCVSRHYSTGWSYY